MISVTIIVKNGERYLGECLSALDAFEEIILLDNGSRDRTLEIASQFQNVKIVKHHFIGFGPLKNLAADHAGNSWILSIDCDEILSPELLKEIQSLSLDERCVYRFSRRSYYNQKWIRGCGWYPDRILRIYSKERAAFNANQVHESVVVKPDIRAIFAPVLLLGTHDNCAHDLTLLNLPLWRGRLDRANDHVTDATVVALRATQDANDEQFAGTTIVGDV